MTHKQTQKLSVNIRYPLLFKKKEKRMPLKKKEAECDMCGKTLYIFLTLVELFSYPLKLTREPKNKRNKLYYMLSKHITIRVGALEWL